MTSPAASGPLPAGGDDHGPTASGLDANVAAALAYAMGWVTGVVLLLLEPGNRFVRFHAWQSVLVFGSLTLAWMLAWTIPFLGWILAIFVIPPLTAVLWLLLMYKAYLGARFKVPGAGDVADQRL